MIKKLPGTALQVIQTEKKAQVELGVVAEGESAQLRRCGVASGACMANALHVTHATLSFLAAH